MRRCAGCLGKRPGRARAYLSFADHMVVTSHPAGEALWDGPVTSAGPVRSELARVALLKPDLLPSLLPEYIKLAHQDREWWDALGVFAGCLLLFTFGLDFHRATERQWR